MKILITGETSYVGIKFKEWLNKWSDKYYIDTITLKNDEWKNKDFSKYDALFHVSAVVHQKERPEMEKVYYRVNRDLAIEVATKAKQAGIRQFIFMSSMSVYGLEGKIGTDVVINKDTPYSANTFYGKSKLQAELELNKLNDERFRIAIIRAPMIYGPNCPGNYTRLKKNVIKIPIFPLLNNQRSMIFIDNFCEFTRLILEDKGHGLFFPQNKEYVNTLKLVQLIAKENAKKIYLSNTLAFGVNYSGKFVKALNKIFGNLTIDSSLSCYRNYEYCIVDFEKSIEICERSR